MKIRPPRWTKDSGRSPIAQNPTAQRHQGVVPSTLDVVESGFITQSKVRSRLANEIKAKIAARKASTD